MKARQLTLLVLLNVTLVAAGFYFFSPKSMRQTPVATPANEEQEPVKFRQLKSKKSPTVATPQVVYVTNQFNWREVESADYREYIANLRKIGCPENTIKDIILTDILKLYSARRGQLYHNGRAFQFWETDEKRKLNARQLEERERQLAAIDKEIPAVLRELLGINYERELNKYFVDTNEEGRRLSFLPETKRAQLLALRDEIEGMRERIMEATNGQLSDADRTALREIEERRKAALSQILTAPELAEFELRMSPTADRLRADLIGFNPSPDEFHRIFALQQAIEEQHGIIGTADDPATQAAAQAQLQEELKRHLDVTRYAEYLRSQNPDFRSACVFAEVYELPDSTAHTIFEIKQIAEAERQNLLSNPTIPDASRSVILNAIQAETEKNLRLTLGPKIFSNYAQSSGQWIQHLGAN